MQDAPSPTAIQQMEQRFAACGFPRARITLREEMAVAAITLDPQAEPSDAQLACAARLMETNHLFPGTDTPAMAERLRPFLMRAMQRSDEDERQALIERDNLGPAVASLTPLRDDPRALERRLIALCGPETRKLIRTITPAGAHRPVLELHPRLSPGDSNIATSKAFTCLAELGTAADLHLGFLGNAATPTAPLPSGHPSR
ncbi:MAG: hypothetical protein KGJ57_08380 [Sphingomonadales bacterium]|nr:hypothetical protein [Sphingomonadales bacterium]MDE2169427.1 hypothetical protein [Sphingomonadales bacterium]